MYPDWRFRPGANALAKLKIKDGGTTDRQGAEKAAKGKGKGRNKSSARMLSLEEMRCAKIADFVADGIRGEELEVAVKQWEGDRKMGKEKLQRPGLSASSSSHARSHSYTTSNTESSSISDNHYPHNSPPDSTSNNPQLVVIDPVPPPGSWDDYSPLVMQVSPTRTHAHVHEGQDSFPMPSGTNTATTSFDPHLTWQDENQREPSSWRGDSRSAEVESSTFGYHGSGECASGISEMGYENCGGSQFDSGYVEVESFRLCFVLFLFFSQLFL